ncbi:MAG: hypothetical protein LQ338_004537 [Usnochroma carphineum]|nr:MAG: hypothetical protein LQ338_004537 [Usnochroma carphineum]
MDSVLETLFSSQQEKQQKPTHPKHSETPINGVKQLVGDNNASLRPEATSERPDFSMESTNQLQRIIAMLSRQEERVAASIDEIDLLLKDVNNIYIPNHPMTKRLPTDRRNNSSARRVTTFIKYIERAVQRYDVAEVGSQWSKFQWFLAHTRLDQNSREAIYIHFLSAYFVLSRQEQAVHVWNHMLQAGVTPNERHWNLMLKGCFKAHDVTSLQEVWSNMIASGIEPEQVLYTTYIHGLIMCGKWQRGLQVLDELGARWKSTAKRQMSKAKDRVEAAEHQPSTPTDHDPNTPSLAPFQAALTALTAIQRHELCFPLLDWAKDHFLTPTTEIFNVLLRPAVRSGDPKQVSRIFSLMNANNCSADEVTYTILLNGHMSNTNSSFAQLSPQEQRDSILRILDDMTANNISIDRRTYSSILQGLLSQANGTASDNATQAVLQHMAQNNVNPDSFIYHMLVTHYFSRDPPDLVAVELVWARIRIERPSLQSIVYEKMVEGYAKVGAVEKMMFFLRKIAREGKSPRWRCLGDVLNTLIEEGEWVFVKELVEDARDSRNGLMRYAEESVAGSAKDDFWAVVEGVAGRIGQVEHATPAL